jgi:hypothetical protein
MFSEPRTFFQDVDSRLMGEGDLTQNQEAVMHFSANPASEANKCEGELIRLGGW